MTNRSCGVLLILLAIVLIFITEFLFPCSDPHCIDPNCKDGTGSIITLLLGIAIVIDSLKHKNKRLRRK